jgi:hypothetical protein
MGHAALATYYSALQFGQTHETATAAAYGQLSILGEDVEAYAGQKLVYEVAGLLKLYFDEYREDPIEVLAVETEYSIGILADYELPVRIDLIVRNLNTGRVAAWDHKFVKDFYSEDKVRLMPQMRLYQAGLMTAGYRVDDLVYNMIRHRGTKDNAADPSLRFERMTIPVNPESVKRTVEEHLMAANRIAAWRKMPLDEWERKVVRNTSACMLCSFKTLCAQDLEGEDTSTLIEFEYRPKTRRNEMTA